MLFVLNRLTDDRSIDIFTSFEVCHIELSEVLTKSHVILKYSHISFSYYTSVIFELANSNQ